MNQPQTNLRMSTERRIEGEARRIIGNYSGKQLRDKLVELLVEKERADIYGNAVVEQRERIEQLQAQLVERDQTIARLTAERDDESKSAHKWMIDFGIESAKFERERRGREQAEAEARRYREALKQIHVHAETFNEAWVIAEAALASPPPQESDR